MPHFIYTIEDWTPHSWGPAEKARAVYHCTATNDKQALAWAKKSLGEWTTDLRIVEKMYAGEG